MSQRFCNNVVWIIIITDLYSAFRSEDTDAEIVRVKKSWKLVEINLTTLLCGPLCVAIS